MTDVLSVQIKMGLDAEHKDAFIQLFCDAFPEIIVPVFGSIERCARLLERSLANDRILTAVSDERLVGFAGLHYSGREWFNPSASRLLTILRWEIFRVMVMGIILFKRPRSDVLHLDTLAVHPDYRGQGIGTQLIEAVITLAKAESKKRIALEVEDVNPSARRLYTRLGFSEDKFEKLPWPWSKAFAFSGSYPMSKDAESSEL